MIIVTDREPLDNRDLLDNAIEPSDALRYTLGVVNEIGKEPSTNTKSIIVANIEPNPIEIERGTDATVKLTFTRYTYKELEKPVVIEFSRDTDNEQIIIPASIASMHKPEERSDMVALGERIPGAIYINDLITYSQNSITLVGNETRSIDMKITIPKDWPDELIDKDGYFFNANYKVLDQDGIFIKGIDAVKVIVR
ncbi:MAG: hypothetical protein D6752_06220 [Candidatus Nitrosothermus koennekii]|nr:MAG: hypothetical protein D6752_06220 [Candidatus Nitrosothermus koennekii]